MKVVKADLNFTEKWSWCLHFCYL